MELSSVEVDGIELTYRTAGEAGLLVVVLLHALGQDSSDWNVVVEALAPAHRVYALDLRGHGGSSQPGAYPLELMRSDVLGFLHALDLDGAFLIGHSVGGAVAYLVAAAEPRRVRRLVLEEPAPPRPATPSRDMPSRPDGTLCFDWRVVEAITKQRNVPDPAWWDDLRHITARTLVIAGGPDSHFPQDQLEGLADRIPDASYLTIDAGYDVHTTRPEAFLAALLPFLRRKAIVHCKQLSCQRGGRSRTDSLVTASSRPAGAWSAARPRRSEGESADPPAATRAEPANTTRQKPLDEDARHSWRLQPRSAHDRARSVQRHPPHRRRSVGTARGQRGLDSAAVEGTEKVPDSL